MQNICRNAKYKTKENDYQKTKELKILKFLTKEYHKQIYIFAKIVEKSSGLLLDNEVVTCNGNEGKQEYEPNEKMKIVQGLKSSYGGGIYVIVGE